MVKISNLYQTFYTKDGELEVLKNINFNLLEGEILTLLGPSGEVNINGKVGYMFQKDHLLEWRNIMDNITIGLEIQRQKNDEALSYKVHPLMKVV